MYVTGVVPLFFVCVQDLLQLQYEGVAVMMMFDRARVNVNLLIFLLNKKFYGKSFGPNFRSVDIALY